MMAAGQLSCVSEQQKHSSALWKPLEEVQNLLEAGTRLFFEEMYQPTEAAKVRARILSRRLSVLLVCYRVKSAPLAKATAEMLERKKHDWSV